MRQTILFGLLLAPIAATLYAAEPPQTQPATQPSDADNPFIINDVPLSAQPALPMQDLVRFSLVDDFLVIETTLPPRAAQLQRVEGLAQPIHVVVIHRGSIQKVYTPDSLQLTYAHSEGGRPMRTNLFTAINHLSLSRDIVIGDVEKTIQFIQSPASMEDNGASIHIQSMTATDTDDKHSVSAESFAAFVRRYPAETTQYLRPMLETFGRQPQLFVVEDNLAFNVFPEAFAPSPDQRRQIDALVSQLGDDSYPIRQAATQKLEQMDVPAAAALSAINRASLQPEQATRVDAIIARIKPRFAINPAQLRSDPGFLLDCLLANNVGLQRAALKQLQSITGRKLAYAPGEPDAQHVNAVYALRAQLLGPATRPATP